MRVMLAALLVHSWTCTSLIRLPACLPAWACCVGLQLLVKDVRSRMRLEDVPQHPWIQANADAALLQQ